MKTVWRLSFKHILALFLCALLLAALVLPVWKTPAAENKKVVRVGWYESAFHRTDSFGRKSGYGYEFQQRVGLYAGWDYEYVEGSWSDLFEKLQAGEIDLLTDVSYTEERAKTILYSSEGMGSEDYHAFISPNNTEIKPDDFSTFNGKRVGVNKNSIQEQLFIEWADKHGVSPEIIELTGKSPELIEMLKNGEIDVLVTLDAYGSNEDMIPVCKTGSSSIYFGVNKRRPDIKEELDVAMNRMLEENRYYIQQLAEKYNDGQGINDFLTEDEKGWIAEHTPIRMGYQSDYLPFSDVDPETGKVTGALADYLDLAKNVEKNAELSFDAKPYATVAEGIKALQNHEIDCFYPVNLSEYDGEELGIMLTDPFVKTTMHAAVRTADRQGLDKEQPMTVVIPQGNLNCETFLKDNFPNWNITTFESIEQGFKDVADGKADSILITSYRLTLLDDYCKHYHLSTLSTGEELNFSVAVRHEDDRLFSVLNKLNRMTPDYVVNTTLTNYSFAADRVTFGEFLHDNLGYVVLAAILLVIVILVLVLRAGSAQKRASEGRSIIRRTERDQLTNLYNRDFFFVYANQRHLAYPDKPVDALVLNIERFHTVNTLNGRAFGDEVLRTVGNLVGAFALEAEGIAGRFEGDRFDIYCTHRENYQAVLDHFQAELDKAFPNADIRLRMGVCPWQKGEQPEVMFDLARAACSSIRGKYNTPLMVYDEGMRKQEFLNQRLKNDLSHAIISDEIEVYFQPKFDIQSDVPKLFSAEALIRWNHPELGQIMPGDFVPLFEESGQITLLDNYVWKEAARQVAEWKKAYGVLLPVSINLSRVDVFDRDLLKILDGIVNQYELDRKDLKLEITESAYTENSDHLIQIIGQLREQGYEIEMDDFGSGYSSLNMLSSMPVDVLKMDREFILHIEEEDKDRRLVELILNIGKNLKIPVIAEGVETEGQIQLLRKMGCPLVQGFYFSKPLPADAFAKEFLQGDLTEQ